MKATLKPGGWVGVACTTDSYSGRFFVGGGRFMDLEFWNFGFWPLPLLKIVVVISNCPFFFDHPSGRLVMAGNLRLSRQGRQSLKKNFKFLSSNSLKLF